MYNNIFPFQGKREERIAIMFTQSELFSRFLSIHIGTERIMKFRRIIFNQHSNMQKYPVIVSKEIIGSKSEGLDIAGSDVDVLLQLVFTAIEKGESNNTRCEYVYDSLMDTYPGYVILQRNNEVGDILSCHKFQEFLNEIKRDLKYPFSLDTHGPAVMKTILGDAADYVFSIKSESWPNIAKEWINRKRQFGWPSQEMIYSIVQNGCHIVPVGSSRSHYEDIDWRLSFCTAEKELIQTFNHTQMLVYGVLKLVLKDVMDKQNLSQLICSYFLKTVMFWAVEETNSSYWVPRNIFLCFQLCIKMLILFVVDEYCPNYFVIGNNMFRERFNTSNKKTLLKDLYEITSNGWQWVLQNKSLQRFSYLMSLKNLNIDMLKDTSDKKEKIDVLNLILSIVSPCKQMTCYSISGVIPITKYFLSTVCKIPIVRQQTIPMLCHCIDTNNPNLGNKVLYALRKFQMQLLIMESKGNLISGKTLLASWLYQQKKYFECLQVTGVGLKNMDLCLFHNGKRLMKHDLLEKVLNAARDFTEIQYLSSTEVMFPVKSVLVVKEISNMIGLKTLDQFYRYFPMYLLCPRYYMCFLRCLCYFRLEDKHNFEYEYAKMNSVCDTHCDNFKHVHWPMNFIMNQICNKIRHNITIDCLDTTEVAQILIHFMPEFDITTSDNNDFLMNINEIIQGFGLNPDVFNKLLQTVRLPDMDQELPTLRSTSDNPPPVLSWNSCLPVFSFLCCMLCTVCFFIFCFLRRICLLVFDL